MPLYGLCDTGYFWVITVREQNTYNFKMVLARSDFSLHVRRSDEGNGGRAVGVSGIYVDDAINAETKAFKRSTKATLG